MKKVIFLIIFVLSITLCLAGDCIVETFTAKAVVDVVYLEWRTSIENEVVHFEIQRRSDDAFHSIANIKAEGTPSTYKYEDSDAFFKYNNTLQANYVVTYRLKIVYKTGQPTYTNEATVTRNVNSIKRSFGMLKEMFK